MPKEHQPKKEVGVGPMMCQAKLEPIWLRHAPFLGRGIQEDVNGEKLTVKKWWILGAERDINGETKHLVIDDLFHG